MNYYLYLKNIPNGTFTDRIGPFPEYVELTHDCLRGLDGEHLAEYVTDEDDAGGARLWWGCEECSICPVPAGPWTDIVIVAEER